MPQYLTETDYYNFSHPLIQVFIADIDRAQALKTQAIQLYLKVRDGWRYNAYSFHTQKNHFRASEILPRPEGHCLDKSILLVTAYRAIGLPARIHLAKVQNHIGVDRIIEKFGSAELSPHGFVEVYLNEKWVACTPAFNKSLCERLKVDVLEFDGENDSIFQAYGQDGKAFMEYLDDYGTFEDFPYDFVIENLEAHYPGFKKKMEAHPVFTF